MLFFLSFESVCSKLIINLKMMFRVFQFTSLILFSQAVNAQSVDSLSYPYKIYGIIYDESGEPFPGVNIVSSGDGNQQISNIKGEYHAHIYSSRTAVIFSYPKFENVLYCPDGSLNVDIVLAPDKSWFLKKLTWRISSLIRPNRTKVPLCD